MPLAGTICCQTGLPKDFGHCQGASLRGECVFARPLLDEMAGKEQSRENTGISATSLLGCPRQYCLATTKPYYESPANYHARWRGTGTHAMATAYGPYPGVIQERRARLVVSTPAGEAELTGQPDWFNATTHYLEDWKSTVKVPDRVYDDHESQVNIYATLIENGGFDLVEDDQSGDEPYYLAPYRVDTAAIRYIDPSRAVAMPVELWSNDVTMRFIISKMEPIVRFVNTGILPDGIANDKQQGWKSRYCPFRGSGLCCADKQE